MDLVFSLFATLLIIFIVPILIYSLFVKFAGLKEPDKELSFLVSVLVQKVGTAFGFVTLFAIGRDYFVVNWLQYGLVWFAMFTIVEVGQALGQGYSKKEAVAGTISEIIYFPLSAFVIAKLFT